MGKSDFHDYLTRDVFNDTDGISSRRMFGGYGFYKDGIFFGLLQDDQLYFKVGDSNKKDYEEMGSKPFKYSKKDKEVALSFWEVPVDVLEDKERIIDWVEKAVAEAKKSKEK